MYELKKAARDLTNALKARDAYDDGADCRPESRATRITSPITPTTIRAAYGCRASRNRPHLRHRADGLNRLHSARSICLKSSSRK
jgi:hypothetical protein